MKAKNGKKTRDICLGRRGLVTVWVASSGVVIELDL